jgi:hypothetical protein
MQEIRTAAVILPPGNFFDRLFASVISAWGREHGIELHRSKVNAPAVANADLVLADISGRHPAVMYLAGYAAGIGKMVVTAAQFEDDLGLIPSARSFVYAGNAEVLRDELSKLISAAPRAESAAKEEFSRIFGDLLVKHHHEHRGEIERENEQTFVLLNQDMDLLLVQELSKRARDLGLRIKLM